MTQKKGKLGGFYFGPWEFRSRSYWCCFSFVGAPEAALLHKILDDAVMSEVVTQGRFMNRHPSEEDLQQLKDTFR